jgi:hypothetical protein
MGIAASVRSGGRRRERGRMAAASVRSGDRVAVAPAGARAHGRRSVAIRRAHGRSVGASADGCPPRGAIGEWIAVVAFRRADCRAVAAIKRADGRHCDQAVARIPRAFDRGTPDRAALTAA